MFTREEKRIGFWVSAIVLAIVLAFGNFGSGTAHAATAEGAVGTSAAPLPGPFVTFLFSRAEEGTAQNCVPDGPGTGESLTGDIAPYFASLGITGTVTVNTLATGDTEGCTHSVNGSGETLTSSWGDLAALAQDGFSFTPHEYDGPAAVAKLTPQGQWDVTCGQAASLTAHGLPGSQGMISYPGTQQGSPAITALQANYGSKCFDWGRHYNASGLTKAAAASVAPYTQQTLALKGGPGTGSPAYTDPASVIAKIAALKPGQWLTIQSYETVDGVNPPGDAITWSCDQGTPNTSDDVERYCGSDLRQIAAYAAAQQAAGALKVTDPASVASAWGRTAPGMPAPSTFRTISGTSGTSRTPLAVTPDHVSCTTLGGITTGGAIGPPGSGYAKWTALPAPLPACEEQARVEVYSAAGAEGISGWLRSISANIGKKTSAGVPGHAQMSRARLEVQFTNDPSSRLCKTFLPPNGTYHSCTN